jgi:heat-inducible transcriptional repressor
LLRDLRETRDSLDRLMQTVVEMAEQTFETEPVGEDYVVAGQTHLMQYADLSDLDKLRQLFEAFNHKGDLLHLFDQCLHADGVQIFIGEESGFRRLGGLQRGDRALYRGRSGAGRAGRHRPDPNGL